MEELTNEEIVNQHLATGDVEVLEQEVIHGAFRTRITKARVLHEGRTFEVDITYMNGQPHNSVYSQLSVNIVEL